MSSTPPESFIKAVWIIFKILFPIFLATALKNGIFPIFGATLCWAQDRILIGSHIMRCPRMNSYWEPHYAAPMIEFSLGHRLKRLPMIFLSWVPHNMAPKIGKIPFFRAAAKKMGNRILNIIQTAFCLAQLNTIKGSG